MDTGSQQDVIWDLLDTLALQIQAKGVPGAAGKVAQVLDRVRCGGLMLKLLANQTVVTSTAGTLLMT